MALKRMDNVGIGSGFVGTGDELTKYIADSTQGFTLLLAGLKAVLEHGVRLNLTADRYPAGAACPSRP